jgi:hypothetical protein
MQGAWVATQLSTREGFEVKVTEVCVLLSQRVPVADWQIINKRVPVIVYDAGGIPLQVDQGVNGWVVPTDDIDAVAKLLYEIRTGKTSLARPSISDGEDKSPNSISEEWISKHDAPVPQVAGSAGATSEDFWTVGNAIKWMYLATRVLDISLDDLGEPLKAGKGEGGNVWRMAMGQDAKEGEGQII